MHRRMRMCTMCRSKPELAETCYNVHVYCLVTMQVCSLETLTSVKTTYAFIEFCIYLSLELKNNALWDQLGAGSESFPICIAPKCRSRL